MYCQQCGLQVQDGDRFCRRCGARLQTAELTPAATSRPGRLCRCWWWIPAGVGVLFVFCLIMFIIIGTSPEVRASMTATAVAREAPNIVVNNAEATRTASLKKSPLLGTYAASSTLRPTTALLPTKSPTAIATPRPSHTPPPTATPGPPTRPAPPTATPVSPSPTPNPTAAPVLHPNLVAAAVVDVVDGDTIKVDIQGKLYTVRYIGIDCPETRHPSKPVEWMGLEATAANRRLVENQTVYLEKDVSETDQYGRLLRYVYLADGTFVNAELVRLGYAQVSTYSPDVRYQALFLEMQRQARENGRGLWGPAPPPATARPAAPSPTLPPATAPAAPVCDCSGNLYNCSDFPTHAAAQACFDYCRAFGVGDIHRLDGDNDGLACESLP